MLNVQVAQSRYSFENSFQTTLYALQKFYITSDQQYVNHIYLSEIL